MDVKTIQLDRAKAQLEYREYREAVKKNHDVEYLRDLKNAYGHARRGHPILDVWQAFSDTGLDANGDPKIAIARADLTEIEFRKFSEGQSQGGEFRPRNDNRRRRHDAMVCGHVSIPQGILKWNYPPQRQQYPTDSWQFRQTEPLRSTLATRVPIIPARFQPPVGLSNYHILWEVEKWDVVTPPRDPFLLKRISPNVFAVLAAWELTELERTVLRGRIS